MTLQYPPMKTKRCTKCNHYKRLSAFYKDKRHRDGLTSQCRGCHNHYKRLWRRKNKLPDYQI